MRIHRFGRLRVPAKVRQMTRGKKLASVVSVLALLVLGGVGVVLSNTFAANNYTWRIGSSNGITITESLSDAYYLNTVRVDGLTGGASAVCMAGAGTVSGGVATISISANCLEELSVGAHTLSFEFIDDTNMNSPQYATFQYNLNVTSPSVKSYSWQKGSTSGITDSESLLDAYYLNKVVVDGLTGGTVATCLANAGTVSGGTATISMSVSCLGNFDAGSHTVQFEFLDDTIVSSPRYVTFTYDLTITVATYTVTFNANGGNVSETSRNVTAGNEVGSLPVPSRSNYIFVGWWSSASGGTRILPSTKPGASVTYYAHWAQSSTGSETWQRGSSNGVTITASVPDSFYLNHVYVDNAVVNGNGLGCLMNTTTVSGGTATTVIPAGCMDNFTTGTHTVKFEFIDDYDTRGGPLYITNTYNFTITAANANYIFDGITQPSAITGVANGTAKTAAALGLPSKVTVSLINASDLTDYSTEQWDVNWNVAGSSYNPSSTAAQTFTVTGTVTLPSNVTNSQGLSTSTTISVSVNAAASKTYTLAFNTNGGTGTVANQSCTTTGSSCTATIPSTRPTRSGYTFKGWGSSSSTTSASYQPGNTVTLTANRTLYAVWEQNATPDPDPDPDPDSGADPDDDSSDGSDSDGSDNNDSNSNSNNSGSNGVAVPDTGANGHDGSNGAEAVWMIAGVAVVVAAGAIVLRHKHTTVDFGKK